MGKTFSGAEAIFIQGVGSLLGDPACVKAIASCKPSLLVHVVQGINTPCNIALDKDTRCPSTLT